MAAAIREKIGIESELIAGRGGVFDIEANGQTVYSKHNEGDQFPEHDEVLSRLLKFQEK